MLLRQVETRTLNIFTNVLAHLTVNKAAVGRPQLPGCTLFSTFIYYQNDCFQTYFRDA